MFCGTSNHVDVTFLWQVVENASGMLNFCLSTLGVQPAGGTAPPAVRAPPGAQFDM